jgi:hypothetical protein
VWYVCVCGSVVFRDGDGDRRENDLPRMVSCLRSEMETEAREEGLATYGVALTGYGSFPLPAGGTAAWNGRLALSVSCGLIRHPPLRSARYGCVSSGSFADGSSIGIDLITGRSFPLRMVQSKGDVKEHRGDS